MFVGLRKFRGVEKFSGGVETFWGVGDGFEKFSRGGGSEKFWEGL